MNAALQAWSEVSTRSQLPTDVVTEWWETVMHAYLEKHRHFHTLSHVSELCLLFGDEVRKACENEKVILWTIFFHRIVQPEKVHESSDKSAKLWNEFSTQNDQFIEPATHTRVHRYILALKDPRSIPETEDIDLLLLRDMTFAILGAPRERYEQYAKQIRREHSHFAPAEFCTWRTNTLRSFLTLKPNLYLTKPFREHFETNARVNVKWEIDRLDVPECAVTPLYFADRQAVIELESLNRQADPMRMTIDEIKHCLAMQNGSTALSFRDQTTKDLVAAVVASCSYLSDEAKSLTTQQLTEAPPLLDDCYKLEHREDHELHGDHLLLHSLVVVDPCRGHGFATSLLKTFLQTAKRENPQLLRVSLVCHEAFEAPLQRLGFVRVREFEVPAERVMDSFGSASVRAFAGSIRSPRVASRGSPRNRRTGGQSPTSPKRAHSPSSPRSQPLFDVFKSVVGDAKDSSPDSEPVRGTILLEMSVMNDVANW